MTESLVSPGQERFAGGWPRRSRVAMQNGRRWALVAFVHCSSLSAYRVASGWRCLISTTAATVTMASSRAGSPKPAGMPDGATLQCSGLIALLS